MQSPSNLPESNGYGTNGPKVGCLPNLPGRRGRVLKNFRRAPGQVRQGLDRNPTSWITTQNLKKCNFGMTTLRVLGHVVDQFGVYPDPEKVAAVKEFPTPKDVKSVQSFIGLCSYYRKFIKNFAEIARPLTTLTKSSVPFEWGPDQVISMDQLKEASIAKAMLTHPDYTLPMEIHPDASGYGIGAVVVQKIDGKETPLAFASRLLKGSELNYTTTEKECLAAVWAIKKFQYLIWGCELLIVTDHHALCWLMSKKDLAGRLARWATVIQGENLKFIHKSGKTHLDADALSRHPSEGGDEEVDEHKDNYVTLCNIVPDKEDEREPNTLRRIQEDQQQNPEFGEIYKRVKSGTKNKDTKNYAIKDNLLYRKKITHEGINLRLCLPEPLIPKIMKS